MRRIGTEKSAKLNVTIDQRMMDRLDALVATINRVNLYGTIDRSTATREVLLKGLDVMERQVAHHEAETAPKRSPRKGASDAA